MSDGLTDPLTKPEPCGQRLGDGADAVGASNVDGDRDLVSPGSHGGWVEGPGRVTAAVDGAVSVRDVGSDTVTVVLSTP